MSKTKATGATKLGRDPQPKYLGVKAYAGEKVRPGMIIVRQRGTKILAGKNVKRGGDDTIYAMEEGIVAFSTKRITKFDGSQRLSKVVHVVDKVNAITAAKEKKEAKIKKEPIAKKSAK